MKLSDLISEKQKLSTSKIWFNVGHIALTFVFIWQSLHYGISNDMMLTYGGLVCGSRIADKFLTFRYKAGNNVDSNNSEGS